MARKSRKNIAVSETTEINTPVCIRTVQYIRLSVEDSSNKGNSIENQKLILDDFIAQHPDMQCVGVYIDNGTTGTNFNRPEFQKLTADIEAGKIDCVVVKDLSRLGRNSIDTGFYIERYFPEHKIRFIAVNDNYDTVDPKANNGVMLYFKNIINEAYALDIGKKIKTQRKQAMREGQYVAARAIYGYIKDPNDKHKLIVNPDTAPIVKMIFESYAGGSTKRSICNRLINSGIPAPGSYDYKGVLKNTVSKAWTSRSLEHILTREIYTGKLVQGRTAKCNHKRVNQTSDKWITVDGTHEAIISQELFDKAQQRIVKAKEDHRTKLTDAYTENIFKGKIVCGCCGRSMIRIRQRRITTKDRYIFLCVSNQVKSNTCDAGKIYEDEIFDVILTVLSTQIDILVDNKNKLYDLLYDKSRIAEQNKELQRLKAYISQNRNYLSTLYENLVNNIITAEEYKDLREVYAQKISDAVHSANDIENKQNRLKREYDKFCETENMVSALLKDENFTKKLIDTLIDKITVYSDNRIEIKYTFDNEFNTEVWNNG